MLRAASVITSKTKFAFFKRVALCSYMAVSSFGAASSLAAQTNDLGRVLEQAKQRGLLIEREGSPAQNENVALTKDVPHASRVSAPVRPSERDAWFNTFPAASCEAARVLDFRPLKGLEKYEQLLALASSDHQDGGEPELRQSDDIIRSRFFLSLGLGAEAIAALGGNTSQEAALLVQAASLIDYYRDGDTVPIKFSDYADCGEASALWARFEPSDELLTGEKQRAFITLLSAFPPYLADRILLNIATLSAERGERDQAKAFWLLMENRALEAGSVMPRDRTDDSHLYLNALLSLETDGAKALGMLKYLSEKESVFQIPALQKSVELQSGKGLSDGQRAGLYDVSFLTADPVQREQAARIRMDIYLGENAVTDAIDLVKSDMRAGSAMHESSVQNIGRAVLRAVLSHDRQEQLGGLNNYYHDTDFFKSFKDHGQLQTALIKAAIALELPQLVRSFQMAMPSKEQIALITQAAFLEAVQAGKIPNDIAQALESNLSQNTVKIVLQNALRVKDFDTALKAAAQLIGEGDKDQALIQIYWAQAQWTQLSQPEDTQTPQIVSLLAAPLLATPKLTDASVADGQNITAVGEYLSQLGSALDIAKEYLNHG